MEKEKMNELLGLEENLVDKNIEVGDAIEKEVPFDFEQHLVDNTPSATVVKKEEKPTTEEEEN